MARLSITVVITLLLSFISAHGQQRAEEPLTNAAIVKLARAGFSDKAVISIIGARPTRFDLAPDRLIELKKSGVSERVILAMLSRPDMDAAADDWDDDSFFNDVKRPPLPGRSSPPAGNSGGSDPGEINIFGSSGGSRGRTRSRGADGSAEGETETVGSASVRILRPPSEAGGNAAPKLEKTPTLTNDAVVQLVEAGFSEGTIVRRIEQSPVEFDLSEMKLAELRRRRVTEPVIAAMKAAMTEDAEPSRPEK